MILRVSRDLGRTVVSSYRRFDKLFRKHLIITRTMLTRTMSCHKVVISGFKPSSKVSNL